LIGAANGPELSLSWQNTFMGGAPSDIVIEVSGNRSGSLSVPLTDRFAYPSVPAGTYTFAVRAVNAFGSSSPSNAVTLTFPGPCLGPGPPTNFSASKSGSTISVNWSPPVGGAAPTGYIVFVTGSFEGSFATTGLALSGTASPGTYALSVAATNACGISAATPVQTVTIP
jgi:hypothetical protein